MRVTIKGAAHRKRGAASLVAAVLTLLILAGTALAVPGRLTQLSGTAGCVSETGSGGACTDGNALDGASAVVVSPDGTSVYAASETSDAVSVFKRDTTSGKLTQLAGTAGCVSETGSGGTCADGKALDIGQGPSLAISGDGKSVYVASQGSGVAVFSRDTSTGEITQLSGTAGCITETGSGGDCATGKVLDGAYSAAVSPDGKNVYVASEVRDAVAVFSRDTTTGELTQLAGKDGCIANIGAGICRDGRALIDAVAVTVSPDGKSVYVASHISDAVVSLRRNATTGTLFEAAGAGGCISETGSGGACGDGKALNGPRSVAVSADGKHVYAASFGSSAVAVFRRNATTGKLAQLVGPAGKAGCVSEDGMGGTCADGKALVGAVSVDVSGDGESVYVASVFSDAVAVFRRDPASGVLFQLIGTTGQAGCVSETGSGGACLDAKALDEPRQVTVSPDSKSVYVVSRLSDAVAVFRRTLPPAPTL